MNNKLDYMALGILE